MRKLRTVLFEGIALGLIIAWLVWKYPELVDDIVPWLVLGFLWHLTWDFILDTKLGHRLGVTLGRKVNKMVAWPLVFLIGGSVSVLYWRGVNTTLVRLAAIASERAAVRKKTEAQPPPIQLKDQEKPSRESATENRPVEPLSKPEELELGRPGPEKRPTKHSAPTSPQSHGYEGFHERLPEQVTFSLGGGGVHVSVLTDSLRKGDAIPIKMGDFIPIRGHFRGDILYCDVTLWGGPDEPPVEIKNNEFVVRRSDWDRNFSENAFEVVNDQGLPMLQVIRKTPSHWVVNGVFTSAAGVLIATDKGTGFAGNVRNITPEQRREQNQQIQETLSDLKPIFKYPSYRHQGEYIDKQPN
jgi:hypothetical protein